MTIALQAINPENWDDIYRIQLESYHSDLIEDIQVLQQKSNVLGHQCRIVFDQKKGCSVGYILAHPYPIQEIPNINEELTNERYQCRNLFIHDFCLCQSVKNRGYGEKLIKQFLNELKSQRFESASLIAVQDSSAFWARFGFKEKPLNKPLLEYGLTASYMEKKLS
jgi:hypothetical protein